MTSRAFGLRKTCAIDGPTFCFLLSAGIALLTFGGCTSSHTLVLHAMQPVYFGNVTPFSQTSDSAAMQFAGRIAASSAHVAEKEKVVQGDYTTFSKDASEGIVGDFDTEVGNALGNDPEKFIGDTEIRARIEQYVPLDAVLVEVLGMIFIKEPQSEGMGEASSETIEISGTVFKIRRAVR